jgi:hypothetical protein
MGQTRLPALVDALLPCLRRRLSPPPPHTTGTRGHLRLSPHPPQENHRGTPPPHTAQGYSPPPPQENHTGTPPPPHLLRQITGVGLGLGLAPKCHRWEFFGDRLLRELFPPLPPLRQGDLGLSRKGQGDLGLSLGDLRLSPEFGRRPGSLVRGLARQTLGAWFWGQMQIP